MNRKTFLKRLGLLSTTAIAAPTILAETLKSQNATTKTNCIEIPTNSVERMRIDYNTGITYYNTY